MSDSKYTVRTSTTGSGLNTKTTTVSTITDSSGNSRSVSHTSRSVSDKISSGVGLFGLVFLILAAVSVVRMLIGGEILTFGGLLDCLANVPQVDMSLSSFSVIPSLGDWGAFNFLSTFLNLLIDILNLVIYAFKGLSQVVLYVVYFVQFVFV